MMGMRLPGDLGKWRCRDFKSSKESAGGETPEEET